jgi:allantoicase
MGTFFVSELSSAALGGAVLSISDEFFAEAFHLLLTEVTLTCYSASYPSHGSRILTHSLQRA